MEGFGLFGLLVAVFLVKEVGRSGCFNGRGTMSCFPDERRFSKVR